MKTKTKSTGKVGDFAAKGRESASMSEEKKIKSVNPTTELVHDDESEEFDDEEHNPRDGMDRDEEEGGDDIQNTNHTFETLGIIPQISEACTTLGFKKPTPIQVKAIPPALEGRDIIGLAQTGSGKTAAFALPILQALWNDPQPLFACIMAPTRELAVQIAEQFEALGSTIGVRCAIIVGGFERMEQAIALSKRPHIVICTPGRIIDHLENTKGFHMKNLKYLVLDEADRLLDNDFGADIEKVLKVLPQERHTYLFSATMTTKVEKLQRACLRNPVKVEISTKYSTVSTLLQYYLFIPFKFKDCYLAYLLNEFAGQTIIVFTMTRVSAQKLALFLRNLGFPAVCLHAKMSQQNRLGALQKFKSGDRNILIATDVAARGLDIKGVDVVLNYDVPQSSKLYIHRVGRTARAGKAGKSITLVNQYDLEWYQRVEHAIGKKLEEYPIGQGKEAVMVLQERVAEAVRLATIQMREEDANHRANRKRKKNGEDDDGGRGKRNEVEDDDGDTMSAKVSKRPPKQRKQFRR